jgi:beta-ketoacyl synthase-like protein
MSALPNVAIEGIAFWHTRLPGWEIARAVICGEQNAPEAAATRPTPNLLAPTERRRAPDTVALALEVAARACEAAERSPAQLQSVFASTYGDLGISDYMCATLAGTPTLISPTKFHNSVHNAAAGYWSIGTASHTPYTAISAYRYTFASAVLEAATQVVCDGQPVVCVAFDVESKGPFGTVAPSRGLLGAALVLAPPRNDSRRTLALRVEQGSAAEITPARSAAAALVAENALAPCLPFFEALAHSTPASVVLALSDHCLLRASITAARPSASSSPR